MARNKKVEILSNDKEVLHPMTDGDCVIFEDGQTLVQKLSEDDSVKYTPEIVNSSPMFKVGEGNTVDYSDNVLDGAYERATLQGQTYVNYIQESSADEVILPTPFTEYERTQHNTLTSDEEGTLGINLVGQSYVNALQHDSEEEFVVLGESLEFQEKKVEYTNEGQIKSAMLKGQTLVNLAKTRFGTSGSNVNLTRTEVENGMTYTVPNQATGYITIRTDAHELLKPSTTYTILFEIVENTIQDYNGVTVCGTLDSYFSRNENQLYHNSAFDLSVGKKRLVVTTHNNISTYDGFGFGFPGFPHSGKEDAGVFTIKNVMVIEGDHSNEDIPFFEGMQSVTVSTRLENLCHKYNDGLAKNGKTFTTNSLANRCIKLVDYKDSAEATYGMKPNTKYLVQFKISNLVLDGLSSLTMAFSVGELGTTNCLFKNGTKTGLITANGVYRVVLTTTDVVSTSGVEIKGIGTEWESSDSILRSLKISEVMYVEYQNGMENWNLPYFEDYQVMKPVQVESASKNLININNVTKTVLSTYTIEGNSVKITQSKEGNGGSFVAYSHYLESGQTYTYSATFSNPQGNNVYLRVSHENGNDYGQYLHDEETVTTGSQTLTFTCINSGNHFFHIYNKVYGTTINVGSVVTWANIQLEESDTATEYVPHQSKTTYSWDEVILRKVGDVEDTLDLTTGEWVQRIGEIDFHDYSYVQINTDRSNDTYTNIARPILDAKKGTPTYPEILCNKFSTVGHESYVAQPNIVYMDWGYINITVPNSSLGDTITENSCLKWLRDNNIKIIYPLDKPIVHKVNLSRPNLQTYDDITHVHTKCLDGTLIPNIYLPNDISYPAILEPSTTYNVCINHTEVSADNPLKVNVGGTEITMTDSRMTLTTPTTLANSNVSFTGKGNKIKESMLIKNSSLLTRDLPHFNGIGSVQLCKTIENLCSGRYIKGGSAQATLTDTLDTVKFTTTTQGSCVLEFPILTPLENGKTYFVYAPVSGGWANYSFVRTYNNSKSYLRQPMDDMENPQQYIVTIDQLDNQYASLCIGCHGAISVGTTYTITRPILCEYEPGMENWDWESIGYFTGTKNIGNEFMRVQNKNLFDGTIQNHYWNAPFTNGSSNIWKQEYDRIVCTQRIPVSKGKQYYLSGNNIVRTIITFFKTKNHDELPFDARNGYTFTSPYDGYIEWYLTNDNINNPISNIQIEESSTATTYTAHKHNGLYITKDQPIELTWEQGRINPSGVGDSYTNAINNAVSYGIRNKGLLNLKPNTTYRISLGDKANYKYHIAVFDNWDNALPSVASLGISGDWISSIDTIFTTTKDAHKIGINVQKQNASSITSPESVHAQVRLEEVTDVILRSCSSKYDELDLTRGIYTQNVGMVYLDGINSLSQQITVVDDTYQPTDKTLKSFDIRCVGALLSSKCSCNKFPSRDGGGASANISFESVCIHSENVSCRLTISTEKASTLEEFKLWLQDNPLEILYQLKTPIVHKVHIGNKNEANIEVTKPNDVFTLPTLYTEQTHIDLTNNGIIPKVQSRNYIAYPVSPMVGRTYTLQHNLTGGVSNLTVDLLGRTQQITYQNHKSLVYTPETMDTFLHNELRISGKGKISRVMYIDGGYMDRDIPYIEGMKNAVNPIVKNIGKNLFNGKTRKGYYSNGEFKVNEANLANETPIRVKPSTNYCIISDGEPKTTYYDIDMNIISYHTTAKTTSPKNAYFMNIHGHGSTYFQVEEDIEITERKPYKENICYVGSWVISYESMIKNQSVTGDTGQVINNGEYRYSTDYIEITTPRIFINSKDSHYVFVYDKNRKYIGRYPENWSTSSYHDFDVTEGYFKVVFNHTNKKPDVYTYIASEEQIFYLRSLPNGVHDEIDLETGKYIQRVGEITFNGTESWLPGYSSWSNKYTYYNNTFVDIKVMKGDNGSGQAYYDAVRCPQLHRSYMGRLASALIDGICSYYYGGYQRIFISKQDCATVDELKLWLKENPITVQYELPEPIVKDIVIHNYPHSYKDGHVIIENGNPNTPIPAQLTYRAVTNRSGQIQQHTEQVEKQDREINELETLILANIHLSQTR